MFKATKNTHNPNKSRTPIFNQLSGSDSFFHIQTKLSVGKADDSYEREADAVANKVVSKTENNSFGSGGTFFPPATIQKKMQEEPSEEIQKKSSGSEGAVPSQIESALRSTKGDGNALGGKTKIEMEQGFGADFSNIKIHNNNSAAQMSNKLGAQAFTIGNDIYFNSGKFNPTSKGGKHLLAHELTHTLQQSNKIRRYRKKTATNFNAAGTKTLSEDTFDISTDKKKKPWIKRIEVLLNKVPIKDKYGVNYYTGNLKATYYANKFALSEISFPVSAGSQMHKTTEANHTVHRIEGQGYMSSEYSEPFVPDPTNKRYVKGGINANMHYAIFFKGSQAIHRGQLDIASHGCVHAFDNSLKQLNYHTVNKLTIVVLKYV